MSFWIITSAMAVAAAALLVLALLRARGGAGPAAAYDLRVYRDQLKEVDRDLARGVIGEADAERIRAEVSRRILAADAATHKTQGGSGQPQAATVVTAVAMAVLVLAGSALIYRSLGAPGYGDLGLKHRLAMAEEARRTRPDQSAAEAGLPTQPPRQIEESYKALIDQLRTTVAARPDDAQGHDLLAQHEANSGNFQAAYQAKEQVLKIKGNAASAQDFSDYAELLIMAAGGYVSPQAEAALAGALERDRSNGPARYYWGAMMAQTGRSDIAFRIWEETLRAGPPDAYWIEPIRAQIEQMAATAGIEYTLSPAAGSAPMLAGPNSDDVAAAADMTAEGRQDMIRGMVDRLSERLASEGGSPAEWARLIGALGVLGDTERASAIYDEAKQTFAKDAAALQQIEGAAQKAGIGG
ncbi:c-type cytochrome biogenesis protein CcmI [Antarcticimicrobium sediminis]|uniref:C-type cytochrome biogenesis protein CcmI n=1 Tax=Antarcticimicrobium sediminis TaxID=2546227 RepID=A0A4R5F060_9RHOB|nr:c-type cytochrome biogenesis protein CcmI [Antarcticimicrobium sediminis]TDE40835.1 c-type cytochrome biogenesis protein CcmI [Antarcticimicrobium sediminis]